MNSTITPKWRKAKIKNEFYEPQIVNHLDRRLNSIDLNDLSLNQHFNDKQQSSVFSKNKLQLISKLKRIMKDSMPQTPE